MIGALRWLMALLMVVLFLFVGVAAVEPVGEQMLASEAVTEGPVDGETWIDRMYNSIFIVIPLVTLGLMLVWAIAWYLRRERSVRRF